MTDNARYTQLKKAIFDIVFAAHPINIPTTNKEVRVAAEKALGLEADGLTGELRLIKTFCDQAAEICDDARMLMNEIKQAKALVKEKERSLEELIMTGYTSTQSRKDNNPDSETANSNVVPWSSLPVDIARVIFSEIHNPFALFLVCKRWCQILQDDKTWKLMCMKRWPSLQLLRVTPDDPHFWNMTYQGIHERSLGIVPQIKDAVREYGVNRNKTTFATVLRRVEREKSSLKVAGFKGVKGDSQEEQFFLDSVIYTHINAARVEGDKGYFTKEFSVKGYMMGINNPHLKFEYQSVWNFTPKRELENHEDSRVRIGDALFEIPGTDSRHSKQRDMFPVFIQWLRFVRHVLGWTEASLPQILRLVEIIMIPDFADQVDNYQTIYCLRTSDAELAWDTVGGANGDDDDDDDDEDDDEDNEEDESESDE